MHQPGIPAVPFEFNRESLSSADIPNVAGQNDGKHSVQKNLRPEDIRLINGKLSTFCSERVYHQQSVS